MFLLELFNIGYGSAKYLENMCLLGHSLSRITDDVLDLLISNCREGLYS